MKKIKIWLFKKIFINETKAITEELENKEQQIENLKKRCSELIKANNYLLHQNANLQQELKYQNII